MKRVFGSAAAVVFGVMVFSGIGNSVASASEQGPIRSRNDLRATWSHGLKVTKITSRNDYRMSGSAKLKVTKLTSLNDRRHKSLNKAIAGRDGVARATGR